MKVIKMRAIQIFLFLIIGLNSSIGQEKNYLDLDENLDTPLLDTISEIGDLLDDIIDYHYFLDREFSKLTNNDQTNFGTFASISTEKQIASINGSIDISDNSSLNIGFKGGVNDGIAGLLGGTNFSPNINFSCQYNVGIYSLNDPMIFDATQLDNLNKSVKDSQWSTIIERQKVADSLKEIEYKFDAAKKKFNALSSAKSQIGLSQFDIDSLTVLINSTIVDTLKYFNQIKNLDTDEIARQMQAIETKKVDDLNSNLKKLSPTRFKLKWWSIYVDVNNNRFKSLNRRNEFSKQIIDTTNTSFEVGIKFNSLNKLKSNLSYHYSSLSLSYALEDNFGSLTKFTVTEKEELTNDTIVRTPIKTLTAYEGEYKNDIHTIKVSYDSYTFPNSTETIGLHFNPFAQYNSENGFQLNTVLGVVILFKEKDKPASFLNAELFYQFTNLLKLSSSENLFDRSNLGIRLNFPITIK